MLTLIYQLTDGSNVEFTVKMSKHELLYRMYLISSPVQASSKQLLSKNTDKEMIKKHAKAYLSKLKTPNCCFWKKPTLNITTIKLGKNSERKIHTDFSKDTINITTWLKQNNLVEPTVLFSVDNNDRKESSNSEVRLFKKTISAAALETVDIFLCFKGTDGKGLDYIRQIQSPSPSLSPGA